MIYLRYNLIASDLDGTLLNDECEISEQNQNAIKKLTDMGIYFVPSTGRTLAEITPEIKDNPYVRYIIYSDGAVIYDKKTGKRSTRCITNKASEYLLDTLNKFDCLLTVRANGKSYIDESKHTYDQYQLHNLSDYYQDLIYKTNTPVSDYDNFCKNLDSLEMVCAFFQNDKELEECKKELLCKDDYIIASSAPHSFEVFSKDAGKGTALKILSKMLDVDIRSTIAVGDSINDTTIIQAAGLGLAVGNTFPELIEIADKSICTNNEHAIEYILNNYIVKGDNNE